MQEEHAFISVRYMNDPAWDSEPKKATGNSSSSSSFVLSAEVLMDGIPLRWYKWRSVNEEIFAWGMVGVKTTRMETSVVLQWLRLRAPIAGGLGSIPDQGTRSHMLQLKIPRAATKTQCSQIFFQKEREWGCWDIRLGRAGRSLYPTKMRQTREGEWMNDVPRAQWELNPWRRGFQLDISSWRDTISASLMAARQDRNPRNSQSSLSYSFISEPCPSLAKVKPGNQGNESICSPVFQSTEQVIHGE